MCEYCEKGKENKVIFKDKKRRMWVEIIQYKIMGYKLVTVIEDTAYIAHIAECPMCNRKLGR